MNGSTFGMADNTQWFVEPLTHSLNGIYEDTPSFFSTFNTLRTLEGQIVTVEGHIVTGGFITEAGSTAEDAIQIVRRHIHHAGGRSDNSVCSYSTFVPNLDGPGWIGIDIDGWLFSVDAYGTVTTMAGRETRPDVTPYDYRDASIPLDKLDAHQERVVGTFEGDIPFNLTIDLAIDPRDHRVIYVADTDNHRIAKVDLANPAHPVITTYAGSRARESGYKTDVPQLEARFDRPYSLVADQDPRSPSYGSLYVADRNDCAIRKISPPSPAHPDGWVTTVAGHTTPTPGVPTIPTGNKWQLLATYEVEGNRIALTNDRPMGEALINYPQVIRMDSIGNLIFGEDWTRSVRRVNMKNGSPIGNVERINFLPADERRWGTWIWLDVDRKGNIGRVDDILIAISETLGSADAGGTVVSNNVVWRMPADKTQGQGAVVISPGWPVAARSGLAKNIREPLGHYPWAIAIDDQEARFVTVGYANVGLFSVRRASLPGDLFHDPILYDNAKFVRGFMIFETGTVPGFGYNYDEHGVGFSGILGYRPGFSSVHGTQGYNLFGSVPNFDDLALRTDEDLAAYIQNGMGGSVPRPEITGNDLRDLIYFIRKNSLQGATSEIIPNPDYPDKTHPDKTDPMIQGASGNRIQPSRAVVSWETDEPTIGLVEYGTTAHLGLWTEIEPGYSPTHSVSLERLPSAKPIFYRILAKDVAGNLTVQTGSIEVGGSGVPIPGDVNLDGLRDITDAILVIRWILGLAPMPALGSPVFQAADVTGNGVIEIADAIQIIRTVLRLI